MQKPSPLPAQKLSFWQAAPQANALAEQTRLTHLVQPLFPRHAASPSHFRPQPSARATQRP
jgi:hypothetical protein